MRRTLMLCSLVLVPVLLGAQAAGSRPFVPPDIELKAYLALTGAQLQALRDLQKARIEAEQAVYKQLREKDAALHALVQSGSMDAYEIGRLTIDIRELRKQLPAAGAYSEKALAVLNPDQKTRLAALAEALVLQPMARQAMAFDLIQAPPADIQPATRVIE